MPAAFDLTVRSSSGEYHVRIGERTFEELLSAARSAFVIADERFATRLGDMDGRLLLISADEKNKTHSEVEHAIESLRDLGAGRGDELIAVGGGIVQDVATAVAQLYMRGLRWTYAPTTLLAMCDSCIGGKSSLNVGGYKNLAGSFHPPALVVVDPVFLGTLPDEDRAGGLCEAMKISFCRGPEAFERYLERYGAYERDPGETGALLHHALAAKTWFIEIDEFDQAERRLLNFGHTFGHALEAATDFAVSHGIGVGIGVVCAERVATFVDGENAAQPRLVDHALELVRQAPRISERLSAVDHDRFERAFLSDKKHRDDGLHLILPGPEGSIAERVLAREPGTLRTVRAALEETTRMVGA
jgi:3-dehydroquinate synthase